MTMSILSEMVFAPTSLIPHTPVTSQRDHSIEFGAGRLERPVSVRSPWIIGETAPHQTGSRWPDLCASAASNGMLLDCSLAALERIPVSSIPKRWTSHPVNQPLNLDDLQSAELVEITCRTSATGWGWPPEIDTLNQLPHWLAAIRRAIGSTTPIGLGLSASITTASLRTAVETGADYLVLHDNQSDAMLVNTLVRATELQYAAEKTIPILVRTRRGRIEELMILLALGASAVTIDGVLADIWSAQAKATQSFMGATFSTMNSAGPCPIASRISKLNNRLEEVVSNAQVDKLSSLISSVRALSEAAAKIARIPWLGEQ